MDNSTNIDTHTAREEHQGGARAVLVSDEGTTNRQVRSNFEDLTAAGRLAAIRALF